jgi:UDP-N-acetylglucosamine transferase subunit ALG13
MIFVTVGTQLPFNRLIQWVDAWAKDHPDTEVFVQCGSGGALPVYAKYSTSMSPDEWEAHFRCADLVISHAGMGTILKSLDFGKPLVIVPRIAELHEHRNNHQLATANHLKNIPGLYVAENQESLNLWLNTPPVTNTTADRANTNLNQLCAKLREYVLADEL